MAFQKHGFTIYPNFISETEIEAIEDELKRLLSSWDPVASGAARFSTETGDQHSSDQYFRDSGQRIAWFLEQQAPSRLASEPYRLALAEKMAMVNKCGHALHTENEFFHRFVTDYRFNRVLLDCGLPAQDVVQSMFICKPPNIGGAVNPHQDETFVTPTKGRCTAFWIALDDATLENGCLQVAPKSHGASDHAACYQVYNSATDRLDFTDRTRTQHLDGLKLPDCRLDYQPVPVPRGSLVVFDGRLVHASQPNGSSQPRHALTFHCIDSDAELDPRCWLGHFGYKRCPLGGLHPPIAPLPRRRVPP